MHDYTLVSLTLLNINHMHDYILVSLTNPCRRQKQSNFSLQGPNWELLISLLRPLSRSFPNLLWSPCR